MRLGVDVTMSDIHCTRRSLFFQIVKMEPKIGYEVGAFVEVEQEGFLKIKKRSAKIMDKKSKVEN